MRASHEDLSETSPSFRRFRNSLRELYGRDGNFDEWQDWNRRAAKPDIHRFRVQYLGAVGERLGLWAVKVGGAAKSDVDDVFLPMVRCRDNGAFVEVRGLDAFSPDDVERLQWLTNRALQAFAQARAAIVAAYRLNYLTFDEWIDLCLQARQQKGSDNPGRRTVSLQLRRQGAEFPDAIAAAYDPAAGFIDGCIDAAA